MNMHHQQDSTTAMGTLTGTVFTVAATIDTQDYMKTMILALVGATVSFAVSVFLKWLWKILRGPQEPRE